MTFPKISPAIIVLITDEKNRILLAHNKNFKNAFYSLLAGFVEAGESLEQTVVRELKEEVNIDVDSIKYCHSQPWPFPDSIMLGFRAKYAGGELKPVVTEITVAGWFSRYNLPEIPGPGAIARFIIDQWKEGRYK
jgi:NAD+ diphosphatase